MILHTKNPQLDHNFVLNYFNYFSEIEESFIRRRGKALFLSPLDWALIETWQEREIPLHIVLRGIDTVFDNFEKSKKKRSVKSLAFCSEEIEAQFDEWREAQIGKGGGETEEFESTSTGISNETIAEHLDTVLVALETAKQRVSRGLQETLDRVLQRLAEVKGSFTDAETLETDLTLLEKIIDESLLLDTEPTILTQRKTETDEQLKGYKKQMKREVYEQTYDIMLLKKLREEAGIPRLSLFHL